MAKTFQERVHKWVLAAFGERDTYDLRERNHRFLEEALELVQACGMTSREAHALVDYVFERPAGQVNQEVGGTMTTLAALCLANQLRDMGELGEEELLSCWSRIEKIRAKQAGKPRFRETIDDN